MPIGTGWMSGFFNGGSTDPWCHDKKRSLTSLEGMLH